MTPVAPERFLRLGLAMSAAAAVAFVATGSAILLLTPVVLVYGLLIINNWKAAYWLLLCSLPLSFRLSFAGNTVSLCVPDEPQMIVFTALAPILLLQRRQEIGAWWYLNALVVIVALSYGWTILSVISSTVPFYSVKFLIAKTWLLAAFFILPVWIFKDAKDIKTAFVLLLWPTVLTMLVIFVAHAGLKFSFASINQAIGLLYENHVEYSSFISMLFPLLFVACLWYRGRNTKKFRLFAVLSMFFILMIFLSYARAAVLAIAFALIVYYAIRKRVAHLLMPAIYGVIALVLFYAISSDKYLDLRPDYEKTHMYWNFSDHMKATIEGRDESSMERLYRWIAAIRMSREKPLFGYGPHGFYYNYKTYALSSFKTFASGNTQKSTTHNYFLYMLAEQGYPAMLLYAILNAFIFARAQRIYHRLKDRFLQLATLGIAMALAASFVNNFFSELIETHKVGSLFYLLLALLVILDRKSREVQENVL